ncbi:MAG: Fic family protein [Planctomycetes bacterium]|nr:Fic family protein [Planctomycetota bacterium]
MRKTGKYNNTVVAGEEVAAFIPFSLPPRNPSLQLDDKISDHLQKAVHGLSQLSLASEMVPSIDWFIYGFVRKEAVVSSQIEGTQATLVDLLQFEAYTGEPSPGADVVEVCNYLDALSYARSELKCEDGLPISMRLLNQVHKRLMQGVRGQDKLPGEIRRSQNWIGGTRPGNAIFVPPPHTELSVLLSDFEKYIHAEDDLHPLVRAGLLHVQFETIHPFLDGNGRIGRLLVTLFLEHWQLLPVPLLYLSLFFKRHRSEYYRRLAAVRTEGDWEGWTQYFLEGVSTIAKEATTLAKDLFTLIGRDRNRVLASDHATIMTAKLFELLPKHPIITIAKIVELLSTTKPTANKAVQGLLHAGILQETTGKKRDRAYGYTEYLDLLKVGTELP